MSPVYHPLCHERDCLCASHISSRFSMGCFVYSISDIQSGSFWDFPIYIRHDLSIYICHGLSLFTSTMGSLSGVMGVELASLYFLRGHSLALSCLVCKQHWLIYVGWFFQCLVQRGERASGLLSGSAFVLERPSCWAQSSSLVVLPLQRCLGFQCQRCLLTHGLNKKVLFCSQLSFSPCCRSHYLISFHM